MVLVRLRALGAGGFAVVARGCGGAGSVLVCGVGGMRLCSFLILTSAPKISPSKPWAVMWTHPFSSTFSLNSSQSVAPPCSPSRYALAALFASSTVVYSPISSKTLSEHLPVRVKDTEKMFSKMRFGLGVGSGSPVKSMICVATLRAIALLCDAVALDFCIPPFITVEGKRELLAGLLSGLVAPMLVIYHGCCAFGRRNADASGAIAISQLSAARVAQGLTALNLSSSTYLA